MINYLHILGVFYTLNYLDTFGHVWSKQRNRLGPDKAEKLVKAYRYLRRDTDEPYW